MPEQQSLNDKNPENDNDKPLVMRYAGRMIEHLGAQMYSGAVGAVAELIANAWDANATEVNVTIPFNLDWENPTTQIVVSDNGTGMARNSVIDQYLIVGRDRRDGEGIEYTPDPHSRRVMGRKGIGKLACFGIAKTMTVKTINNGSVTEFRMEYDAIINEGGTDFKREYYPHEIRKNEPTDEPDGTTIILGNLTAQRRQSEEAFLKSMARRFSITSDTFKVVINGKQLDRHQLDFQFRYPNDRQWQEEDVLGFGKVRWWAGSTTTPIKDEDARGFVVMVNGKMAQSPFFFNLSGGIGSQHGLQYFTGEIEADTLDTFSDRDLIATDRATIRWDDRAVETLLEWGQSKVRELLKDWSEKRTEAKIEKLKDKLEDKLGDSIWSRIDRFTEPEQKEIKRAIRIFAETPQIDDERFTEIVELLLRAYEDQNFLTMIRALNAMSLEDSAQIVGFLSEVKVLEAVRIASIMTTKVEIIKKFEQLIDSGAPEKLSTAPGGDMHTIIKENPWLLDPAWDKLEHEKALDKVLIDQFHSDSDTKSKDSNTGRRRLDFFCLADTGRYVVVELKRPGIVAGRREYHQVQEYVDYLNNYSGRQSNNNRDRIHATGFLVVGRWREEDKQFYDRGMQDGIEIITWKRLWERSLVLYGEFLELVKSRAPNDPRVQDLNKL